MTCLPNLGEKAPDFKSNSTMGPIKLSDYCGKWIVLFSHPGDFTPVCTTEFLPIKSLKTTSSTSYLYSILLHSLIYASSSSKVSLARTQGYMSFEVLVNKSDHHVLLLSNNQFLLHLYEHFQNHKNDHYPYRLSFLPKLLQK